MLVVLCCCCCRHVPDDIDLAAEEAAEAARLASMLPQLRDAADREGGKKTGSGMPDGYEVCPYMPVMSVECMSHACCMPLITDVEVTIVACIATEMTGI